MKHNGFEVKISDMLRSKVTDTLHFEQKMITSIENLTAEWVSGKISLFSLGGDAIFAKIEELSCTLLQICDRCGKEYQEELHITDYTAKYVTQLDQGEDSEEDILLIDTKNGVIDLEELIYHAIKIQEPFVRYCEICEDEGRQNPEENEEHFRSDS